MDSLVQDALRTASTMPTASAADLHDQKVRISVIGVGGAGTNTVNRLKTMGIESAETIAINTDVNHLKMINADKRVLIGKQMTRGLGAGGFPEVGMKAAESSRDELRKLVDGAELVFITAGMGGGTGTGAAPVVAKIAKEQGAITVGMVTYPFALERARLDKADWGLDQLRDSCDTVVVIDNNRLVSYVPNLPMNQAFAVADTLVARSVKGISDTVTLPSLMNIDFADLRMIMGNAGVAAISIGEGKGANRVEDSIETTLKHPLLDVDYAGSKGALLLITGGPQLSLGDAVKIGEGITDTFDSHAYVKWGARIDPSLGDKVVVTAIVTGVTSPHILGRQDAQRAAAKNAVDHLGLKAINF